VLVIIGLLLGGVPAPAAAAQPRLPSPTGWPLAGTPEVIEGFVAPEHRYGAGHRGVDLAARPGVPVLAAAALAVRWSVGGPILFRQARVGRDGREFEILKFRTMRNGDVEEPFPLDGDLAPGGVEGSDRRTRVGTFLRKTSIDELPQLLNVLKGDMSLVGPRPERPEYVTEFAKRIYRYGERHRVKSGITGWAQVHGLRGKTSISDRAEWDNYYIENFSLWLDLKIVLLTGVTILRLFRTTE
jgi:lipopolysaccharide/colanic/teichoic acid biosynthesis glycosyltransferase